MVKVKLSNGKVIDTKTMSIRRIVLEKGARFVKERRQLFEELSKM